MLKQIKAEQDWTEQSLGAKGFTLIELLVVIVILGILAAVVVFAVGGITDKGKVSACKTQDSTVKTAVEAYNAQWGAYPAATTNLVPGFLQSDPNAQSPTLVTVDLSGATPAYSWGTNCSAPNLTAAQVTQLGAV